MPTSPFQRAQQEELIQPEGSSLGSEEKGKRKRRSKPTSSKRSRKQKTKDRYAHAREDAQLEGLIPTSPEEALQPERVSPSVQGNQPMSELVAQAIRKGWATPENVKPGLIDEMVAIVLDPEMPSKAKIAAFNALRMADRSQWEQDNPIEAGKAKGSVPVTVSVQSNVLAVSTLREMFERDIGRGETALPPPTEPSALGNSRFDGEVEVGAASTGDK